MCRDRVRKAKVLLELILARDAKNTQPSTGISARKECQKILLLINMTGKLGTNKVLSFLPHHFSHTS